MNIKKIKKLIIGIGNESRGDDGLGWRFVEKAEAEFAGEYKVKYRFQLQVEDAELVSKYDYVIFVDATIESFDKGFDFSPCSLTNEYFFSSHRQSPEAVVHLSETLYKKLPEAFIMRVCGHEWDMGIGLSVKALCNLEAAYEFFKGEVSKSN